MFRAETLIFALLCAVAAPPAQGSTKSTAVVYLQTLHPASSDAAKPDTTADIDSFVRTFLQLRLLQTGRVTASPDEEPPCSAGSPGGPSTENVAAESRDVTSLPPHFRVAWAVQPRYDSQGNTIDITMAYDVFKIVDCQPTTISHESLVFTRKDALGEISAAADTIANKITADVIEKLKVFVKTPTITGPKGNDTALKRAITYALTDSDGEYRFVPKESISEADYSVESDLHLISPKGSNLGDAQFVINIRRGNGEPYPLKQLNFTYQSDKDLFGIYLDAGNAIVNALSEMHDQELAKNAVNVSDFNAAIVGRLVNGFLCHNLDAARNCASQPGVALDLLNNLSPKERNQPEMLELRGVALFARRDFAGAGTQFDLALAGIAPGDVSRRVELLHQAGTAWDQAGAYDKAADRFRQDLELRELHASELPVSQGPQPGEYVDLIRAYRNLDKLDQAMDIWIAGAKKFGSTTELQAELDPILSQLKGAELEKATLRVLDVPGISGDQAEVLHTRLADTFAEREDYSKAAKEYLEAFNAELKIPTPDARTLALRANNAGVSFTRAQDYDEALRWNQVALDRGKGIWPEADPSTYNLKANLVRDYLAVARFVEAEALIRPVVDALEKDKDQVPDYVADLDLLASALVGQHKYDEARAVYSHLEELQLRLHGSTSHQYAIVLFDEAWMYDRALQYKEAEAAYTRALPVFAAAYGTDDYDYANILVNIGVIHQDEGDYKVALENYKRALPIFATSKQPSWRDEAMTLCNISLVYSTIDDAAKAEDYVGRGMKIIASHGDDSDYPYYMASAYHAQGKSFQTASRYSDAIESYGQSLNLLSKTPASLQWETAYDLETLADIEIDRGEFGKAEANITLADKTIQSRWGPNHSRRSYILRQGARLATYRKHFEEATALIGQAATVLANQQPDHSASLATERERLALARADLVDAEKNARDYLQYCKTTFAAFPSLCFEARESLAYVLAKKGDSGAAKEVMVNNESDPWPQLDERGFRYARMTYTMAMVNATTPSTYDVTLSQLQKAEGLYNGLVGPNSPLLALLLRDEAEFLSKTGKVNQSAAKLAQAENIEKQWN